MPGDPAEQQLPDHVHRWLEAAQRRVARDLDAALSDQIEQIGLRHLRVLQLVPAAGLRQQELAERANVTKQAIAETVADLEADGLVERRPDPSDGRAWLVRPTRAGARRKAQLESTLETVELELAREVGATQYKTFMKVLRSIATQ